METGSELRPKKPKTGGSKKGAKYNRLPPMLHDMRWAYRNAGSERKGTGNQERFRKLYADKPAEFIAMLDRLERQCKPVKNKQPTGNPVGRPAPQAQGGEEAARADVGELKCVELVERLLNEAAWKQPG